MSKTAGFLILFFLLPEVTFSQVTGTAQFSFFKKHSNSSLDPCNGKSIGQTGLGTDAICAGTFNGATYLVTPGACSNSATPTCPGTADQLKLSFGANGTTTGQTSTTAGSANSAYLAANYSDTAAAKFCENMTYGGYADWFLPAKDELNYLYTKKASIAGFNTASPYFSSSEGGINNAWIQKFSDGTQNNYSKSTTYYIRCVRKY